MIKRSFRAAFPNTVPILAGFLFLGFSYGVYANVSGFSFLYPALTALFIYGGSLEFVVISMLNQSFSPLQTFLTALLIQARHLFYGIAMLDKFRGTGKLKPYLIFGMCDETFSVNYSAVIPPDVDRGWFMFFVTFLNQAYWVFGAALGGLCGRLIPFNTAGLDFIMTALFVVIFLEQWLKEKKHYTALTGLCASALCLILFGADSFLLPAMGVILLFLTVLRGPIEKAGGFA